MNLSEIRTYIKNQSDYKPTNIDYDVYLNEQINTAYREVWNSRAWTFAHKESFIDIYRDLSPSYGATSVSVSVDNGSRRVTFSNTVYGFGIDWYDNTWQGQIIELDGVDYEISSLESTTALLLKKPYRSETGNLSASSAWKMKHIHYRLPEDCANLISWTQVDTPVPGTSTVHSMLTPITATDNTFIRRETTSNWASHLFRVNDINIPPAVGKTITQVNNSTDTDAIPDSTYVEFTWCYGYAGRYGPVAESSGIELLDAGAGSYNTVIVAAKDVKNDAIISSNVPADWITRPVPYPMEGLKKYYLFNINIDQSTGERTGEPCWVLMTNRDPAETSNTDWKPLSTAWTVSQVTVRNDEQLDPNGQRWTTGPIQQVRPWPRIDYADKVYPYEDQDDPYFYPYIPFKQVAIRYIRKPTKLATDQDTPDMPEEFHYLIAVKALESIAIRNNKQPTYYSDKYNRDFKTLERRYATTIRTNFVRESWDFGTYRGIHPQSTVTMNQVNYV